MDEILQEEVTAQAKAWELEGVRLGPIGPRHLGGCRVAVWQGRGRPWAPQCAWPRGAGVLADPVTCVGAKRQEAGVMWAQALALG